MFGKEKAEEKRNENVSSQNFGSGEEKREERPRELEEVLHKIINEVADDIFRNDTDVLYQMGRECLTKEMEMKIPEGKKIWNVRPDIARSVEALGLPEANTEPVLQVLTSLSDGGVYGMIMVVILWKDLIQPMEEILKSVNKTGKTETPEHAEDLHE